MRVIVRYFAYIRDLVRNTREETVELSDNATLEDLLVILSNKYGKRFWEYVIEERENRKVIKEHVVILINGKSTENLEMKLKDGDSIALMPFLGGG